MGCLLPSPVISPPPAAGVGWTVSPGTGQPGSALPSSSDCWLPGVQNLHPIPTLHPLTGSTRTCLRLGAGAGPQAIAEQRSLRTREDGLDSLGSERLSIITKKV